MGTKVDLLLPQVDGDDDDDAADDGADDVGWDRWPMSCIASELALINYFHLLLIGLERVHVHVSGEVPRFHFGGAPTASPHRHSPLIFHEIDQEIEKRLFSTFPESERASMGILLLLSAACHLKDGNCQSRTTFFCGRRLRSPVLQEQKGQLSDPEVGRGKLLTFGNL